MNIPADMSRRQTKSLLLRQLATSRYMILGTVIITVVNLLFLLFGTDVFMPYCAAAAYYLVWLGKGFDNAFGVSWELNGIYTRTGLLFAAVILGVLLLLWWLSKKDLRWIKVSIGLLVVDTVLLLVFAFAMLENPLGCLVEVVLHIAAIWEMSKAFSANRQLWELAEAEQQEAEEANVW